jgi:hypothetical protein
MTRWQNLRHAGVGWGSWWTCAEDQQGDGSEAASGGEESYDEVAKCTHLNFSDRLAFDSRMTVSIEKGNLALMTYLIKSPHPC